ncbi:MFS transporter [Gilvimarinus sp. DA14]|uniref:MFS transporter n=1 Tax=Gilvimarinus sp. DA14 TaxID=2956798 RepID=UPI0020B6ADE7|nr:MFS transporter [Gilvimarinus sp. DA14]UTF60399.1 MFS transporter [Gilvimarinus sp. DA14]
MSNTSADFKFFSFIGRFKVLHLTWMAFFVSFLVWFNHAPLLVVIQEQLALSDQQIKTLLILNVALTIPARIIVGMLVDSYGPRTIYSVLLAITGGLCLFFSLARSFEVLALARFLLGFAGAGFVIGIRMISEWFPARQLGLAEGMYKGLGNIGSAAAAISLPALALWFGGENGWRYATGATGILAFVYAAIYYLSVRDTPAGSTYFKPNKSGGLAVTSKRDFVLYLLSNIPMFAAMALLAWKVEALQLISAQVLYFIYAALVVLYLLQCRKLFAINKEVIATPVNELYQYKFKQVMILSLAYAVTFGAELAVVSMLPMFFQNTFAVPVALAGVFGACFAAVDMASCPSGGWISDNFGRKRSLTILLTGAAIGFFIMASIDDSWPIALAVAAMMCSSFFLGSAAGCVFAMVPLIRRSLTGQIAGIVGAYGNIGAVVFLTVFSLVDTGTFFLTIAIGIALAAAASMLLDAPQDTLIEVMPDGSVQRIPVH